MSMRRLDGRRSRAGRGPATMSPMEILLVLALTVVLGLFAQAVGADSRDFGRGRAA
jgi:hypothetical protein